MGWDEGFSERQPGNKMPSRSADVLAGQNNRKKHLNTAARVPASGWSGRNFRDAFTRLLPRGLFLLFVFFRLGFHHQDPVPLGRGGELASAGGDDRDGG